MIPTCKASEDFQSWTLWWIAMATLTMRQVKAT